jgi:hypothetical protein
MEIRRKERATKPSAVAKRRAAKRASPRKGATSGLAPWLLSRQAGMKLLGVSEENPVFLVRSGGAISAGRNVGDGLT